MNQVLQVTDLASTRKFAVRIDSVGPEPRLDYLLDRFLKNAPIDRLLREGRITPAGIDTLTSIQDFVYTSSNSGELTNMYANINFRQNGRSLETFESPRQESATLNGTDFDLYDIEIDRTNLGYDRNWKGFNARKWNIHADQFSTFVNSTLNDDYGQREANSIMELDSSRKKLQFVKTLSKRIWASDFENYSRFTNRKLIYKSGDETVLNIIEGAGGICSEKVQALKFLTDHYGIQSDYLLAGPDIPRPVPESRLRELLDTFDFRFARRHMRYWQHTALLYTIGEQTILVDATNGNIPFLFIRGRRVPRILGYKSKPSIDVRMAINKEDYYYHKVSQDIPNNLFFAMECWIEHVDLIQVFDNELGLCIYKDFMVAPLLYRTEKTRDTQCQEYLTVCRQAGLECFISTDWELESHLGMDFADRHPSAAGQILNSKEHLIKRYDNCHGTGHDGALVVIKLDRNTI